MVLISDSSYPCMMSFVNICVDLNRKRDILLAIMTSRMDDHNCERYSSAQKLRLYLRKEWYWGNILKQCIKIRGKMIDELPDGFESWFVNQRRDHLDHAFSEVWGRLNTKESDEKIPELRESSLRVMYRYVLISPLLFLKKFNLLN